MVAHTSTFKTYDIDALPPVFSVRQYAVLANASKLAADLMTIAGDSMGATGNYSDADQIVNQACNLYNKASHADALNLPFLVT